MNVLGITRVVVTVCAIPCIAHAQTTFKSKSEFLRASDSAVLAAAGAVDLRPSAAIDSIVLAESQAVKRFYGFSVTISLGTSTTGSFAHPTGGIVLDRRQLASLEDSLGANAVGGIAQFLLAHEWAHMQQYRYYPLARMSDSTNLRDIECDADIWAGMALVNIAADSGVQLSRFLATMQQFSDIGFRLGTPYWELAWMHPSPSQRSLCVAEGIDEGVLLRWVRRYEVTHDSLALRLIGDARARDPDSFGPGDDVLKWSNAAADKIVHGEGGALAPKGYLLDLGAEVARWIGKDITNPDSLLRRGVGAQFAGARSCTDASSPSVAEVRCEFPDYASASVAAGLYGDLKASLRPVMFELNWGELQEVNVGGMHTDSFVRADRRGSATLSLIEATRTVVLTVALRRN